MKNRNSKKSFKKNEFSEEFLSEFGLMPNGKGPLADKVEKPGQYTNTQNTQELVEDYFEKQQWIPSENQSLTSKKEPQKGNTHI